MLPRRLVLISGAAAVAAGLRTRHAAAQLASGAASFIKGTGDQLMQVVNGGGSTDQKSAALAQIIDSRVDVNGIARFCLGRFWRVATPQQQQQYLDLFHRVLVASIDAKIGEYQGVTFTIGRTVAQADGDVVSSIINRPGQAPANVDWVVQNVNGSPKIVDVVADGTSLRLTQRSDYSSFIVHNKESIQALLDAMKKQVSS